MRYQIRPLMRKFKHARYRMRFQGIFVLATEFALFTCVFVRVTDRPLYHTAVFPGTLGNACDSVRVTTQSSPKYIDKKSKPKKSAPKCAF